MNKLNKIIRCGDCIEVLQTIPPLSVDMSLFSPPYDKIRDYGNDWSIDLPALGKEMYRVTKWGGICAMVMGDSTVKFAKTMTTFRTTVDWCDNAGWRLFECCIYRRHARPGAWWAMRFRVDHEYIILLLKGRRPRYFDKSHMADDCKHAGKYIAQISQRQTSGELVMRGPITTASTKCRGTVWDIKASTTEGNAQKAQHPATFPDNLAEDLIRCFSEPGDLVVDPMCGSGTTCAMALKHDRKTLGIEINPAYCEIARERLWDMFQVCGVLPRVMR